MLTKALNSKANIKQFSAADLPFNPKQPVIQRYEATSTSGQTVINLPFSVDMNAKENFQLFVNGALLREGSSNDFQFTAIDTNHMSSQVTLNYGLLANLNIIAVKMGLKKESEFLQDNRFVDLYEGLDAGLQPFVSTSAVLTSTTTTGTPAAGQFYSSILNRASIPDLTQDLKARMGFERVMFQQMYEVQNEIGPSNQRIFALTNDRFGLVRFVGNYETMPPGTVGGFTDYGVGVNPATADGTDYMEVTFYGTGFNLLTSNFNGRDIRYTINGGVESSNILSGTYNGVIAGRKYSSNTVIPIVSGLTLGLYTIKIRNAASNVLLLHGYEVQNVSSSLRINPGIAYRAGKKITLASQYLNAYNTTFESGTLGTGGGRVIAYLKSDGTVAKSVTPSNFSPLYLSSANHANEEVIRSFYPREFGSGRTDDFSTLGTSASSRSFTLEDGTHTLCANTVGFNSATVLGETTEGLALGASGFAWQFTFVGTGLDMVMRVGAGSGGSSTFYIDGVSIGNPTLVAGTTRTYKICSGLVYGTHTVRWTNDSLSVGPHALMEFKVYGPKKPSVPSGAVEIADFNILANYSQNATAGLSTIGTGVIRKANWREFTYGGSGWSLASFDTTNNIHFVEIFTSTSGDYFEYTFFGTGFEFRSVAASNKSNNNTVTLNGLTANTTNFPTMSSAVYGGFSFNSSTGIFNQNNGSLIIGSGLSISNLPLGLYKVRFTNNTANQLSIETMDIITPIHITDNASFANLQAITPIAQGLLDLRNFSPVPNLDSKKMNWNQVLDIGLGNFTSTSSGFVAVPRLKTTIKTSGNPLRISYGVALEGTATAARVRVFINGIDVEKASSQRGSTPGETTSRTFIVPVKAGVHVVQVYIQASSGGSTVTVYSDSVQGSYLTVEEMK
jgi:hypothetical protein